MELNRQFYLFGSYDGIGYESPGQKIWKNTYDILRKTALLDRLNVQDRYNVSYHMGLAQILQAYSFFYMVDLYGDVPFSEANNVQFFPDPKVDDGASVYNAHITLLDLAISNLNASSSDIPEDYYFEGGFNKQRWISLANTLKIRAYTNMRLLQPTEAKNNINVLLNSNYINSQSKDFQWRYGDKGIILVPTEHPIYSSSYVYTVLRYLNNNYYDFLNVGDDNPPFIENGEVDPRARYYFYRQTDKDPSGSNLPCINSPEYDYCYVGNTYVGRDHGDAAGFPSDTYLRTAAGIYPAGGAFDSNQFKETQNVTDYTLEGRGIAPILMSFHVNFMLAETSLTIGVSGNPKEYLETAIRQSMDKVLRFSENVSTTNPDTGIDYASTQSDVNTYVAKVLSDFEVGSTDEKLTIIAREYHLATFGNGIEMYNMYRRTGKPDLQASIYDMAPFPRSWRYPELYTAGNPNISTQPTTNQVFWDTNPASGFID
jgi:hypothetical protein